MLGGWGLMWCRMFHGSGISLTRKRQRSLGQAKTYYLPKVRKMKRFSSLYIFNPTEQCWKQTNILLAFRPVKLQNHSYLYSYHTESFYHLSLQSDHLYSAIVHFHHFKFNSLSLSRSPTLWISRKLITKLTDHRRLWSRLTQHVGKVKHS